MIASRLTLKRAKRMILQNAIDCRHCEPYRTASKDSRLSHRKKADDAVHLPCHPGSVIQPCGFVQATPAMKLKLNL